MGPSIPSFHRRAVGLDEKKMPTDKELKAAFKQIDENHDKKLTYEECFKLFGDEDEDDTDLKKKFKDADKNRDKTLTLKEFMVAAKKKFEGRYRLNEDLLKYNFFPYLLQLDFDIF